jgi:mannose-6-phosphate isomerase-like protein (cupin superfamily)
MPKSSRTSASHIQDYGPVEERREDFADTTVQFLTMRQDMDATPLFKGLPDDECSCPHWGYVFKGRLTFDCVDHEEVFEPGDAFYVEAGHVPTSSEPGTEYLQFSPTEQLQIVRHAGFSDDDEAGRVAYTWGRIMARVKQYAETGRPDPVFV